MVATEVGNTDHVPPAVVSVSKVVSPWQTLSVPVIGAGEAFTVIAFQTKQPEGIV